MFHRETYIKLTNLKIHEILFYVFLFCIPFQTRVLYNPTSAYINDYFNYHLAFFVYLSDLILITCFISWFIFDKPKIVEKRLFWLILAFLCFCFITLFHVKHLSFGLYTAFKWLELWFLVIYLVQTFKTQTQYLASCATIFSAGFLQSILALWQFHVQHNLGLGFLGEYIAPLGTSGLATITTSTGKVIRAYGTMPHPNVLGAFLIFALFMGFFLFSRLQVTAYRILVACGTFIMTLGIFVTFSRLAWLAAAIGYFCFIVYAWLNKRKSNAILLAVIGIVACGTILIAYKPYLKARAFDTNQTSITDRYFFDQAGIKILAHNPIIGAGAGNYVPAMEDMFHLESWQYQPAHNIFIFIAAEFGIVGLVLFLWIIWKIFHRLRNIFSDDLVFTFSLLFLLFLQMGQLDHYFVTIQQGRLTFFVVLGLVAALPNLTHEKSN